MQTSQEKNKTKHNTRYLSKKYGTEQFPNDFRASRDMLYKKNLSTSFEVEMCRYVLRPLVLYLKLMWKKTKQNTMLQRVANSKISKTVEFQ